MSKKTTQAKGPKGKGDKGPKGPAGHSAESTRPPATDSGARA